MSTKPCPVDAESMNVVYSSHTIEHVIDDAVLHMFKESFRMLKPGGVFRITAPNAALLCDAYFRGDALFIDNELGGNPAGWKDASIEERLLYCFASQRVRFHPEADPERLLDSSAIRTLLSSSTLSDALDLMVSGCSYEIQMRHPGNHINWWNHDKLMNFMGQAGFREIRKSAYGQSRCAVLRNVAHFDNTRPQISLYVEAVK